MRFLIQRFADPVVIWRWVTSEDNEYLYSSSDGTETDPYWALVFSDTPDQVNKSDVIVTIHGLEGSYVAPGDPNPYINSNIDGLTERSNVSTITYLGTVTDISKVYTDQDIQGVAFNTQGGNYIFSASRKLRKPPIIITEFGFMSREDKNILDAVPEVYSTKTETISYVNNEEHGIRLFNAKGDPISFIPVMLSRPLLSEGIEIYGMSGLPLEDTTGIVAYNLTDIEKIPEDTTGVYGNESSVTEPVYIENNIDAPILLKLKEVS